MSLSPLNTVAVTASPSLVVNTDSADLVADRLLVGLHVLERQQFQRAVDIVQLVVVERRVIRWLLQHQLLAVARELQLARRRRSPRRSAMRAWSMFMMSRSSQSCGSASTCRLPSASQVWLSSGRRTIDLLRHVALGADAAMADDQRDDRLAGRIEHPQQVGCPAFLPFGSSRPSRLNCAGSVVRGSTRRSSVRAVSMPRSLPACTA